MIDVESLTFEHEFGLKEDEELLDTEAEMKGVVGEQLGLWQGGRSCSK